MKIKKIAALGLSMLMISSSMVANAKVYYDEDNWVMDDAPLSKSQVEATFVPNVEFKVTKLADDAAVNEVQSGFIVTKGTKINTELNDIYKLEMTVSNIGDLIMGYTDDEKYDEYEVRLYDATVALPGLEFAKTAVVSGNFGGKAWVSNYASALGNHCFVWNAGEIAGCYPAKADELGISIENATMGTSTYLVALPKGAEIKVTPSAVFGYRLKLGSAQDEAEVKVFSDELEFPPAGDIDPKAELAMEVKFETKTSTGYVWEASITKGEKDVSAFKATFVSEGDSIDRSISNIGELVKQFEGKGSYAFNIGLITGKTLDSATFTVEDADGAYPVVAPLN